MDNNEYKDDAVLASFINYMKLALCHKKINYLRDIRFIQKIETVLNEDIKYENFFYEDDDLEISNLNQKELYLLDLRYTYGLSYKEISDLTNETIDALKQRKKRAVNKLKDIIGEWIIMEEKTEFYKLLKSAVNNDVDLMKVLEQIMQLINKYSRNKRTGIIDEDLKSELIKYSIELIRVKKIYKKF